MAKLSIEDKGAETIHIRKRPNAPGIEPVYCGARFVASVTDAWGYWGYWGYWGPEGDGWEQMCKACVKAKAGKEKRK